MPGAGNSYHSLTLYEAASGYLRNGYGVIPVYTDLERAKVAAVAWRRYQQQRPTPDEMHTWFIAHGHTGLAIVTGAISGLVVLDFDDRTLYEQFQEICPDLAATRTIRTRRGFHLWFHVAKTVHLASRKGRGIDLKAEGGYVVAPPTQIDSHTYTVLGDEAPMVLTDSALSRIQAFIAAQATMPAPQEHPFSCDSEASLETSTHPKTPFVTASDLLTQYRYRARYGSRNVALFHVSCMARDQGYPMQITFDLLADLHAQQPAAHKSRKETHRQRYREALATIASAYSRSPRRSVEKGRAAAKQLPNSVREALFKLGCTHTVRVLEGLRLAGIRPGQQFTTNEALQRLAGQVGKHSIYQALKATPEDGQPVFDLQPLSGHSPKTAHADTLLSGRQTKKCILVAPKNREEGPFHRPARVFIMPSNEELCLKLNVQMSASDPLTEDDLTSAKKTRMAAHRELIKRRPGMYPRKWLARRLGVCTETIDSYNREIPINVRACYYEKPITWRNLNDIPLSQDIGGTFLEDEAGKRYPARREIARKLLAHRQTVIYKRQDVNFYWYDDAPAAHEMQPHTIQPMPPAARVYPLTDFRNGYGIGMQPILRNRYETAAQAPKPTGQSALPPASPMPVGKDQPEDRDRLAERVYQTVSKLSRDSSQRISQANARRLVETYGVEAVDKALDRLKGYARKGRVARPAGFLITASRLAWRAIHAQKEPGAPAPRFRGVAHPESPPRKPPAR